MNSNTQPAFANYLLGSTLWMLGMTLQGFLFSWLLVDVLDVAPEQAGLARGVSQLAPLLIVLFGGVLADRLDARRLLFLMHIVMALPGLALAALVAEERLSFAAVLLFGSSLAALQALSDPARQAALSRVTPLDMQRSVTVTTIVTSLPGIAAFWLGGRLDTVGLTTVLIAQALCFLAGAVPIARLPALPSLAGGANWRDSLSGLRLSWQAPLLRDLLTLSFVSATFNAGAYVIAVPFIVSKIYDGDAALFSTVMICVTVGSIGVNLLLVKLLPVRRPGRIFLSVQLTRALILLCLWLEPPLAGFYGLMLAWGINMGISGTLGRALMQEAAPATGRAQVLSLLLLSFLAASAIGAPLLGVLIGASDPLTSLLPGAVVSIGLFFYGYHRRHVWHYISATTAVSLTPATDRVMPHAR